MRGRVEIRRHKWPAFCDLVIICSRVLSATLSGLQPRGQPLDRVEASPTPIEPIMTEHLDEPEDTLFPQPKPAPARQGFRFPLSSEARERMQQDQREAARLYGLTNAWLAAALLAAARQAQAASPDLDPSEPTYESRLIWGIVPELARRLGVVKLTTKEIDWEIRELSNYQLRLRAGYTIKNIACSARPGWRTLTRDMGNGNGVVYAIDRLCPGRMGDREDPVVRSLTELSLCRGRPYAGIWTPALNLPAPELESEDLEMEAEEKEEDDSTWSKAGC